jgi:hypothetical protein
MDACRDIFYDAPRFNDSNIKSLLESSLISELESRGYTYADSNPKVDFYTSYVVILEETLSDSDVINILKEYPELNQDNRKNDFEYGSLILSAATVSDCKSEWRRSINDVVNLKMPDDIRQQRLQDSVKRVLESFPVPGD